MLTTLALMLALGCGDVPRAPYQMPRTTWRCIGIRSNRGRWLMLFTLALSTLSGCALVALRPMVDAECPLPADYDAFGNLVRTSCASNEQWQHALDMDKADADLDLRTREAYRALEARGKGAQP